MRHPNTRHLRFVIAPSSLAAACLFALPAAAQQQDEQLWLQVNTNVPLDDGVRLTLEQIARFSDNQRGLYQREFGGLLAVRVAKGVDIGIGYRRVGAYNGNTSPDEVVSQFEIGGG